MTNNKTYTNTKRRENVWAGAFTVLHVLGQRLGENSAATYASVALVCFYTKKQHLKASEYDNNFHWLYYDVGYFSSVHLHIF